MNEYSFSEEIIERILKAQRAEITEYYIYTRLANSLPDGKNRKILLRIAQDELDHYDYWKKITLMPSLPDKWKIFGYYILSKLLGLTFGLKLMERGEKKADTTYRELLKEIPGIQQMIEDEEMHEQNLINLLDEEKLKYISSMVLGLNGALVELTGALCGFTLALQDTRIVAVAGLITGIAASLSMSASEYLASKDIDQKSPIKAAIYTGAAYTATVVILILPFLFFSHPLICLTFSLLFALIIITFFSFYVSVAKSESFTSRFKEMFYIGFGVTVINFIIGIIIRHYLKI